MKTAAPLEIELGVFGENRAKWAESHFGKFAVIQDKTIVDGFFDSYEDAFLAGVRQFGTTRNFLIKQVWITEPVYFVA